MKKPVLFFFAIILIALISIYFIIPQKITTINIVEVDASDVNVAKFLVNKKPWAKWWPGQRNASDSTIYSYNNIDFSLQKNTNSSIEVLIDPKGLALDSKITYLATGDGVCRVTWVTQKLSELNPVSRVTGYLKIKDQAKNIENILTGFKKFIQQDSNIYGIKVSAEKVVYPVVLASTTNTANYPDTKTIYALISKLKQQIKRQRVTALDSPMLNIHQMDEGYQVMVAIPIDKDIKPEPNSVINRLPKGGNLLTTKVAGGRYTVETAFTQLRKYQEYRGLKSPAMPYGMLLTNRLAEPDSSKWVTKIYYPSY